MNNTTGERWEALPYLRWRRNYIDVTNGGETWRVGEGAPVLQQVWKEVNKNLVEWRDVPFEGDHEIMCKINASVMVMPTAKPTAI